jgi:hypothetical protein
VPGPFDFIGRSRDINVGGTASDDPTVTPSDRRSVRFDAGSQRAGGHQDVIGVESDQVVPETGNDVFPIRDEPDLVIVRLR